MVISDDLEKTHQIAINVLCAIEKDHPIHLTQESSTSSRPSMRPSSLTTPIRVPPIKGRWKCGHRASQRHVFSASLQASHPPMTSTIPLFQPSTSLESPLFPPNVPIPAPSP